MRSFLLCSQTLWKREITRFYRQRSRVIGALGSPLIFWLLLGSGIGNSFRNQNYSDYFFPGVLLLIVLFTSIFSTISLIEDRKEGFLQAVLISPAPRSSIVLGKILGGTSLALIQSCMFLLLIPFTGIDFSLSALPVLLIVILINGFVLTSLGFLLAWQFKSIQGFHAVMNLFLFPLWILSGALFPAEGASGWIRIVMWCNPLSYGMQALRDGMQGAPLQNNFIIVIAAGLILFVAATLMASRRSVKDLA